MFLGIGKGTGRGKTCFVQAILFIVEVFQAENSRLVPGFAYCHTVFLIGSVTQYILYTLTNGWYRQGSANQRQSHKTFFCGDEAELLYIICCEFSGTRVKMNETIYSMKYCRYFVFLGKGQRLSYSIVL